MTEAQKFWRDNDIEGCHLIGRDSDGDIQFESIIRNYTSHFSTIGGKESESLELHLSNDKKVIWDLLNETFTSSDIPDLKYEVVNVSKVQRCLWILSELEEMNYKNLDIYRRFHDAVKKCNVKYTKEFSDKISDLHYRRKQLREQLDNLLGEVWI